MAALYTCLFGVKQFHGVYRSTVERFGVSFPEKLLKIVATRGEIFSLKFTKYCSAAGLRPDPPGELKCCPGLSVAIGGLLIRKGKDSGGRREGKEEGKEMVEKWANTPTWLVLRRPCNLRMSPFLLRTNCTLNYTDILCHAFCSLFCFTHAILGCYSRKVANVVARTIGRTTDVVSYVRPTIVNSTRVFCVRIMLCSGLIELVPPRFLFESCNRRQNLDGRFAVGCT